MIKKDIVCIMNRDWGTLQLVNNLLQKVADGYIKC